jgi:hypothetical protein
MDLMNIGFLRGVPWKIAVSCGVTEARGRVVSVETGKLAAKPQRAA